MLQIRQEQAFTPTAESKQIELLLHTFDARLSDFHQVLPRLNPRRGLFDLGAVVLKNLFGSAMSDVHVLDDVVTDLQLENTEIVDSLENKLTRLSTSSKANAEAMVNLSTVLRDQVIQSHDELQNFARDILWLNASLFGQSTLYTSGPNTEEDTNKTAESSSDEFYSCITSQRIAIPEESSFSSMRCVIPVVCRIFERVSAVATGT